MVNRGAPGLKSSAVRFLAVWREGPEDRSFLLFESNSESQIQSDNMKLIALLTLVFAALTLGACGHKKQQAVPTAPAPVVYAK